MNVTIAFTNGVGRATGNFSAFDDTAELTITGITETSYYAILSKCGGEALCNAAAVVDGEVSLNLNTDRIRDLFADGRCDSKGLVTLYAESYDIIGIAPVCIDFAADPLTGTIVVGETYLTSVVAGANITIDDTDPENPIISATGELGIASVNGDFGPNVVLDADDISDASTTSKFTTAADVSRLANTSGTNTGDQELPTKTSDIENDSVVGDITAGVNITIDKTNPRNPVISASGEVTSGLESWNGDTGPNVTADTDDLPEGAANLYYTEARVSANPDVVANAAAKHDAVTISDSVTVDLTLAGQNITADVKPEGLDVANLGGKSHTGLDDIGTNTHAQIDTHIGSSANPHSVTLEQARAVLNQLLGNIDFNDNSIEDINAIGFKDGQVVTWSPDDLTINIPTGLGPVLAVGQEFYVVVYNATASEIENMKAVHPIGSFGGRPSVEKAIADTHEGFSGTILITTMAIPAGSYGICATRGRVSGDTNSFTLGATVYVSADNAGDLVETEPMFPNYSVQVGGISVKNAITGILQLSIEPDKHDTIVNFHNGTFRETFDFRITASGSVITGTLTPADGHEDMTMIFSDGFDIFTATPGATISLNAGTTENLQTNLVYIPKSTKVLTVNSEWPTEEHIKVATVELQSAADTILYGALRNQNHNDALASAVNQQGHLSHIGDRVRQLPSQWDSGSELTCTVDTGSTPDDVFVATTAGMSYQMHLQSVPALDMETGTYLHVPNHPTAAYTAVQNINELLLDASGNSLNSTSFSIVFWLSCNKTGEPSQLFGNLPTDSYAYAFPQNAIDDPDNYSVYEIPKKFNGVGFLVARCTYTYKNDVWTLEDTQDLRGYFPNTSAGGGGGGGGVTTFLALSDVLEADYTGHAGQVPTVNIGETGLEFSSAGAVASVFGRTGNIAPQTGDYTAAQVTNAFDKTADDADDVDDSGSLNKFTTAAEASKLAGIEPLAEVNNISDTNATALTDGGETELHSHPAAGSLGGSVSLPFIYPIQYIGMSGLTAQWTASGSGTNEYYFVQKWAEPNGIRYDDAAASKGTPGSLANHEWGYGDNDSLGYSVIYFRDDDGDPDSLAEELIQYDLWAVDSATYAGNTDGGQAVALDDTEDQYFLVDLGSIPTGATSWAIKFRIRPEDTATAIDPFTFIGQYSYQHDGNQWTNPTAITFSANTGTVAGSGAWTVVTASGTVANLGSAVAGDRVHLALGRDESADADAVVAHCLNGELSWA